MSLANKDAQNQMVECPYDKSHRMLRKRLQQHLLKCRVNHPDVELQTCPFNKTHLIPEPEFVHHVTNCSDRKLITQYLCDGGAPAPDEDLDRVKQEPIQCDENWDDTEVEDYDPKKYIETANVLRQPDLVQPAERKAFIKKERIRLGDYNSDDEKHETKKKDWDKPESSDDEPEYVYKRRRLMTPNGSMKTVWFEDVNGRAELNEKPTTSKEKIHKHKKDKHRSREYSSNADLREYIEIRRGSDNYSPNREYEPSTRSESSSLKEFESSRRSDKHSPVKEYEPSRHYDNYREREERHYSSSGERRPSRRPHNYSPVRERGHGRYIGSYGAGRGYEPSRHIYNNAHYNERHQETQHYEEQDIAYSLDEDPYYGGTGGFDNLRENGYIQYPTTHFSGRGSYRGYSYLGPIRGNYRPFHDY